MNGWIQDKIRSDVYIPEVKRILGEYLIFEGTTQQDQQENTDLIVLTASQIRIGVRVRGPGYFERYGNEFTIRCARPGRTRTELDKIIDGWGDYLFYGHGDGSKLVAWGIGRLESLRRHIVSERLFHGDHYPALTNVNRDGSSAFVAFPWCGIASDFVVAHHGIPL